MDEGKLIADFLTANAEKIWALGKQAYGKADALIQVKLKTAYRSYLSNTREKYSKAKSFFIRNEPVDLYSYYVPTGIECGAKEIEQPNFNECIAYSNRIVLTGSGGSGKSVLMKHLFLDCINSKEYAPVMVELRDLNSEDQPLQDFIEHLLDTLGFKTSEDYIKRAKQAGHFCFFFDGFDEVNPELRSKLIKQIKSLSKSFPKCPIFLSSRPDDVFNGIEDFSVFRMLPLDLRAALSLVEKLPFDKDIKEKFSAALENSLFEKHESFLSNPLLLSIMLLTYGENAEIPSKLSIFYNQAYEALFQRHDANKGGYSRKRLTSLDIQDFSHVFSLFALQTYEKRLFKMPRMQCLGFIEKSRDSLRQKFNADDYLSDLLSAACLLSEDGLEIAFSHRSFQEYFVALHIAQASPEIQTKLIERYWQNMRYDNVMDLLLELNPDLVERTLLIPQLEKIFSDLGVSHSVGMTHTAKYLKTFYSSINVDADGISATCASSKADGSSVLHMAVRHCGTYTFPIGTQYDVVHAQLYRQFGSGNQRSEYPTKSITHRSPIFLAVSATHGIFSREYLAAAHLALKNLKLKHENTVHNLDVLLGI